MEEETLKQSLDRELHNLDLFNLEVAKFRLKCGMSRGLTHLYGAMGRLCQRLLDLRESAENINVEWITVTRDFQILEGTQKKKLMVCACCHQGFEYPSFKTDICGNCADQLRDRLEVGL